MAQAKIEGLERLLLNFIETHQSNKTRLNTPLESMHADNQSAQPMELSGSIPANQDEARKSDGQAISRLSKSKATISINADYKQSLSVDQAHWALLLNEVSGPPI